MIISDKKLKELLKRKGLTKSHLCDKLGISSRTIAKIAKGENVNDNVVLNILKYLEASFEDVIDFNFIYQTLNREKMLKLSGGLYHETQIKLTYNSNHMEGSKLTEDQTRYIFETKTIGNLPTNIQLDDVIETNNHFKCVDYVIEFANAELSEVLINNLQFFLKEGTEHSKFFGAGKYKVAPNVIGGLETTPPEQVENEMKKLLSWYNSLKKVTWKILLNFIINLKQYTRFKTEMDVLVDLLLLKNV